MPTAGSGDVDSSGKIIAYDASQALKHASGKISLQPDEFVRADVDGSGKVTTTDATNINKLAVGKSRKTLLGEGGSPLPDIRMDGEYTVYVKFYNKAEDNYCVASDSITLDVTKPKITHTPIASAKKNKDITFTATVTDTGGSGVNAVSLYWCKNKKSTTWEKYQTVSMSLQGNNTYKATLKNTNSQKIKYCISAADKAGSKNNTTEYIINRQ